MGSFFSRKKKSTIEVLEDLERDITRLETERRHTEIRQKRFIAKLTFALCCLLVAFLAYGLYEHWPKNVLHWIAAGTIVVLCYIPVFLSRYLAGFIFTKRLEWKDETLTDMRERRKDILDHVKETETFKVAMEILEKYDPKTKLEKQVRERREIEEKEREMMQRVQLQQRQVTPAGPVRQRNVPQLQPPRVIPPTPTALTQTPIPQQKQQQLQQQRPPPSSMKQQPNQIVPIMTSSPMPPVANAASAGNFPLVPQIQMARPILPKDRTPMDKVVDYLLGDGPSNRFALICSQCHSHNGMALREEFEFLAFRCCFCFAFNPARRQRPTAPGLPIVAPGDRSASVMELPTEDDALTYASRERSFSENDLTADADLAPSDQRALGAAGGRGSSTPSSTRSNTPEPEKLSVNGERRSRESLHVDDPVQDPEPMTAVDAGVVADDDDDVETPRIARIVSANN